MCYIGENEKLNTSCMCYIEGNVIACDTLDGKEDMFWDEELAKLLKHLKILRLQVLIFGVNDFLKYGGSEIRNKLLKPMNRIFGKVEVPTNLRKTLIESLYKKGDKSECGNYQGINLVSER